MKTALAIGLLGAIALAIGAFVDQRQALFSYLVAYHYVLSIALGSMGLVMICHAMGAVWPTALRRPLEIVLGVFPLLALFYIPFFLGLGELYPFVHPERVTDAATRFLLVHKKPWLNPPFFIARAIGYLLIWLFVSSILRRFSFSLDQPGHEPSRARLQVWSAGLLPLFGLSLTFASFDWVMALSPDWYSTMFGIYYFAGGFLAALALWLLSTVIVNHPRTSRAHYYALGRLLLSFVVFWAYIAYFQFFLIWIANKPVEARWYLDRIHGGFGVVSWLLLFGHFAIPFFALLPYGIKQRGKRLLPVAVWLLVFHYLDVHWLIAPAQHSGRAFSWMDPAALFAVAGFGVTFALWRQRGHAPAPVFDPEYEHSLAYESA